MAQANFQNSGVTFKDDTGSAAAVIDYTGLKVGQSNTNFNLAGPIVTVTKDATHSGFFQVDNSNLFRVGGNNIWDFVWNTYSPGPMMSPTVSLIPQINNGVAMNMGGAFANVIFAPVFCRIGNQVTVKFPALTQTCTSALPITSDATIPANCVTQTPQYIPFLTWNNSVISLSMIFVGTGATHNQFQINNTVSAVNFTVGATAGWPAQSISYCAEDLTHPN